MPEVAGSAIEVRGLRKAFRRPFGGPSVALDGLDLDVPQGSVFGFLGPNGSGKTTTIRCLLGLVRPDAGEVRVLGEETRDLHRAIGGIGATAEQPTLFGGFTGRRNLEILADIGGGGHDRIDVTLERVGLGARGDDLVKSYSLGMRQRLGIAAALLKNPSLLVLDEPGNGLDPAGLKEIRTLLRGLARQGRTVFLSSHLLHEVQLICDTVGIVSKGRCVAQGPVGEVLAASGARTVVLQARDRRRAREVLAEAGYEVRRDGERLLVSAPDTDAEDINRLLAERGVYVSRLGVEELSLEDVFLQLTREPEG